MNSIVTTIFILSNGSIISVGEKFSTFTTSEGAQTIPTNKLRELALTESARRKKP